LQKGKKTKGTPIGTTTGFVSVIPAGWSSCVPKPTMSNTTAFGKVSLVGKKKGKEIWEGWNREKVLNPLRRTEPSSLGRGRGLAYIGNKSTRLKQRGCHL